MPMKKRKLLVVFIVALFFCLMVLIVLPYFVDLNSHKPRVETAASDALGMKVRINGDMGFGLLPKLYVFIRNIKIKNGESDIATLEELKLRLKILPLLGGDVVIDGIEIKNPKITLERDKKGNLNVTRSNKKTEKDKNQDSTSFAVNTITLSDGDIVYSDHNKGTVTELKGIDIAIKDLMTDKTGKQDMLQGVSFSGNVSLKEFKAHVFELTDLDFRVRGSNGLFHIQPLSMTLFGGKGTGEITLDVTGKTPSLKIRSMISQVRLGAISDMFSQKTIMDGTMDVSLNLSVQGKQVDEVIKTMNGNFSFKGESLMLEGYDIDLILSKYRKSQTFGALDIGAIFFAGPLGTALTRGYHFEETYRGAGKGKTGIKTFVSGWKVENGVATAQDMAIATDENRLALKGTMDFVQGKYENAIVAVIDKKGCAEFAQKISGSLNEPRFEKTAILKSVAGSVTSLINRTGDLITGGECEPFYEGSVQHPQ